MLPPSAFARIVPSLILVAVRARRGAPRLVAARGSSARARSGRAPPGGPVLSGVYLTGIYGGYFGAAQGVILIALLAILVDR